MAFVNITNGVDTFNVPAGAYSSIFKNQGYSIIEDEKGNEKDAKKETHEEEDAFDELLEKPVSKWSKEEVKDFASANDIDISGTKTVSEAKELIKEFLDM